MQHFIRLCRHPLSPVAALISVGLLMVSSLSHQLLQWNALLTEVPRIVPAGLSSSRAAVDLKQIAGLFKPDALEAEVIPRNTNLPLTLLGSFVHNRSEQSVAVIQVSGKVPQRLALGDEVIQGVRLQTVRSDHVVLMRGGVSERLFFPRVMTLHSTPADASRGATYQAFHADLLKKLPGVAASVSQKGAKVILLGIKSPKGVELDQR
ncbi:Type II secretion system protein N [compost metagenome]